MQLLWRKKQYSETKKIGERQRAIFMKLKKGIIMEKAGDGYIAVATGDASKKFNGFIRNNQTADFIFRQLTEEKTEEQLVAALLEKYDVSEEVALKDVRAVIEKIRKVGILDD